MPTWDICARAYNIPRDIAFLDTNVLVALFDRTDPKCADTIAAIDLGAYRWAISHATIVEAWNFLVGKVKRRDFAKDMMDWITTPGNVLLIGDAIEDVETAHRYSIDHRIDIVDAGIIDIANRVSRDCGLFPYAHVATYDAGDFLRLFGRPDLSFHVYDMRDLSSTTDV